MISIVYRATSEAAALEVEWDERLPFWPFRLIGTVQLGRDLVERSWRGATLPETVAKAAEAGCLALADRSVEEACAVIEPLLEAER